MGQTYKEILVEAKEEIKEAWNEAWAEYEIIYAEARAEVQLERHQRAIDTLAIQAQLEIDELKLNNNNFWR